MGSVLELLGKGLNPHLMSLVLPQGQPLSSDEVAELSAHVASDPVHVWNRLRLGIHYGQIAAHDKAQELFAEILAEDPGHLDTRLAWGAMHAAEGSLDQALAQFEHARHHDSCDARVLFGLGYCYERQGQIDAALNAYQEGKNYQPYLPQLTQRCAAIYLYRQQYDKAIEQCRQLVSEHPEDVFNYVMVGQLFLQTQQYGQAAAAFERALTIEPDNFEMADDQIETLVQNGGLDDAIAQVREMIATQGEFPDSYVRLGDLHSRSGDDEETVCNYERALELHPGFLEAAVKLGTQHLRMRRYYQAATSFSRAVQINDRLITAYVGLGLAQHKDGQEDLAADTLDLAAALEPNTNLLFAEVVRLQVKLALEECQDAQPYEFMAEETPCRDDMDDLVDMQMERHRKGLAENPNRADLHYHYAMLLRGRGRRDEATHHLSQALTINPSYSRARLKLALALRDKGDKQRSLDEFQKGLTVQHEYVELHYKLGLMYCDKILFALAVEQLGTTLNESASDSNVHLNLALALQNMGLVDRAAATWQAVCELEPESAMALHAERSHMNLQMLE